MQSFSDLFANNRLLAIGVVLAAIAVILAVGIALFRLVFGRRLHMSGGRTRQPRLGVVDAFDLDRQRQLVLIRRDNVEHLLMIGGPNDVLIEAAIVRAPAAVAGRDKDAGFSPSVGIPAPMPQQLTATPALPAAASAPAGGPEGGSNTPFPAPLAPEPRVVAAPEPARVVPAIEPTPAPVVTAPPSPAASPEPRMPSAGTLPPASAPRPAPMTPRPGSALPPRPPVSPVTRPAATPTPRANLSRATPLPPNGEPRPTGGRAEPPVSRSAGENPASAERPISDVARETPPPMRFPPPRPPRNGESAASEPVRPDSPSPTTLGGSDEGAANPRPSTPPRPAPTGPTRTLPPRPAPSGAPAPPPAATPPAALPPSAPARSPMPSLGSLEEEMAKLLGRPMPPSDASGSGS